ncbi:hypothetical protein CVT25_004934 [Psilocybe cyanescens]|uniref:Amidohydrolase-related domain-containing protein n=1 Tax=Psilocybe cyanescens TaxID=93625 RepID=A0A409XUA2_PSICY|nr:hypothetical protein CVT25_004934 [Psilocybe cyanescens]
MFASTLIIFLSVILSAVQARRFRDTGGTIVFEEAWTIPELAFQNVYVSFKIWSTNDELVANLLDVHNQRLRSMNTNNIDFMVLSCAQPCIQSFSDPVTAENMAVHVNNELAATIANNTERFGAFASLAMHNATAAALELKRAVETLGFLGALVNDYQQSGTDGQTLLFYDQPEYDVFWQMVSDLDVPVYFHPRTDIQTILNLTFVHAPFLIGPAQEFAAGLSTHILGLGIPTGSVQTVYLSMSSLFEHWIVLISRFPKLKIIVGHLGERISSDLVRIDTREYPSQLSCTMRLRHCIELKRQVPFGLTMKQNVTTYFRTNIFETTSGNFAPDLLDFHINQIGLDRIMYSIDYPFINIPDGTTFINDLARTMKAEDHNSLARGLAIEVLRLKD